MKGADLGDLIGFADGAAGQFIVEAFDGADGDQTVFFAAAVEF